MEEEIAPIPRAQSDTRRRHRRRRVEPPILSSDRRETARVGAMVNAACSRVLAARGSSAARLKATFDCLVETLELLGAPIDLDPNKFERQSIDLRRATLEAMRQNLPARKASRPVGLDRRIAFLGDLVSLNDDEREVFGFLARYILLPEYRVFRDFLFPFDNRHDGIDPHAMSLAMGMDVARLRRVIDPGGRLVRIGLLEEQDSYEFALPNRIKRFLQTNASSLARMRAVLLPMAAPPTLTMEDFAHLSEPVDDALALFRDAAATGARANILFYGVPGTGKTELARLLAAKAGVPAVEVGNADEEGDEPSRHERLAHLRLCRGLSVGESRAILVIDEAEDLFVPQGMQSSSKLWLNRMVEDGEGVHVWIVNSLCALGEPVIRRMDFALRFTTPSEAVQARIARRVLSRKRHRPSDRLVKDFAALKTSPAILDSAFRTSRRVGADDNRTLRIANDLARASGRHAQSHRSEPKAFDPLLSRADYDLLRLSERLAASDDPWSLLLHGVPGTGKSAFARFISDRSGRDLIIRTGSELLGPYVGQTEQSIASAFEEALEGDAILLIDEADDFMLNREMVQHSWESSMVNEMLRQMDGGRTRFIATTNRAGILDNATARRFSLAVEFKPMTTEQVRAMFMATFGGEAPARLDAIGPLTPGDFAQLARRAKLLEVGDALTICRWLEQAAADRGHGVRAGF